MAYIVYRPVGGYGTHYLMRAKAHQDPTWTGVKAYAHRFERSEDAVAAALSHERAAIKEVA